MLTLTLKGLEEDGLVNRTMYPTIPPRVDYELTDLGRKLIVPLQSLYDWAVGASAGDAGRAREIRKKTAKGGVTTDELHRCEVASDSRTRAASSCEG